MPASLPRLRAAATAAALLGLTAALAAPARGQPAARFTPFARSQATSYDAPRYDYRIEKDSSALAQTRSVLQDRNGLSASAYLNTSTGKGGAAAVSAIDNTWAAAQAVGTFALAFTQGAEEYRQPFELYLDGTFDDLQPRGRSGYDSGSASYGIRVCLDPRVRDCLLSAGVTAEYQNWPEDQPYDLHPRRAATYWVTIPGSAAPGSVFTLYLGVDMAVRVQDGTRAEFTSTGSLYVPTVAGHAWTGLSGALAGQSRPAWAAGPATTVPEPATWATVGAGAALLLGIRRRRAAPATA